MEILAASLTAVFYWPFLFFRDKDRRQRLRDHAGPLFLKQKCRRKPWDRWTCTSLAIVSFLPFLLAMSMDIAVRWQAGSILPKIFFSASTFTLMLWCTAILGLPSLLSWLLPQVLELRQRGLIIFQGENIQYIPWARVEFAQWAHVLGRVQIQLCFMDSKHGLSKDKRFDISADKEDAVLAMLQPVVELRDPSGAVVNPEIHAAKRDASMPARSYQFDLRTLLLFMLFASAAMSWYGIHYHRNAAEKAALARLEPFQPQITGRYYLQVDFSASSVKPNDGDLALLADLNSLDHLDLTGAPITDAGLEHLEHLNSLSFLVLSNTAVGDDGLRHLEKLPRLSYLILYGTRVTEEGVKRFQQASPNAKVSWHL